MKICEKLRELFEQRPQHAVEIVLEALGNREADWAEFKAAVTPQANSDVAPLSQLTGDQDLAGTRPQVEHDDELLWHVAKALISLGNTRGGVVLIGLSEDRTAEKVVPVRLSANVKLVGADAPKDRYQIWLDSNPDEFVRAACEGLTKLRWRFGKATYALAADVNLNTQLSWYPVPYRSHVVLAVLVHPFPKLALYTYQKDHHSAGPEQLLHRVIGNVGNSHPESGYHNFLDWVSRRAQILDADHSAELEKAATRVVARHLPSADDGAIDADLEGYARTYLASWKQNLFFLGRRDAASGLVFEHPVERIERLEIDETSSQNDTAATDNSGSASDLRTSLARTKRLFLYGAPGCGKTTRLKHAVYEFIRSADQRARIPIYLPLSGYAGEDLLTQVAAVTGIDKTSVEILLEADRVAIVLDGANESSVGPDGLRTQFEDFCYRFPSVQLALSSRHPMDAGLLPGAVSYLLAPLDRRQQAEFLHRTCSLGTEQANDLVDALHRQPGGPQIAGNILFLSLAASVSNRGNHTTLSPAQLYRRFFAEWFARERQRGGISCRSTFECDAATAGLAKLAFEMRLRQEQRAPIGDTATRLECDWGDDASALLPQIAQSPLFAVDPAGEYFAFAHETFQEYFAAEHVLRHPEALSLIPQSEMRRWTVVFALLFELCSNFSRSLIDALRQAHPLLPLLCPVTDDALQVFGRSGDSWCDDIAAIMLHREPPSIAERRALPQELPLDVVAVLGDEQLAYSVSRHDASRVRLEALARYAREHFDPYGVLLNPIARNYWKLRDILGAEAWGWTLLALGEESEFLCSPAGQIYILSAAVSTENRQVISAMVALAQGFRTVHENPEFISLTLWNRLLHRFAAHGKYPQFMESARATKFRFLGSYPELARSNPDFISRHWSRFDEELREKLQEYLSGSTLLSMLQSGLIQPEQMSTTCRSRLLAESQNDVATFVAWATQFRVPRQKIPSDIIGRFVADRRAATQLLCAGIVRLSELSREDAVHFLTNADVLSLVQALSRGGITLAELPESSQQGLAAALRRGNVLRLDQDRGLAPLAVTPELLAAFLRPERPKVREHVREHLFVITVPAGPSAFGYHAALVAPIYLGADTAPDQVRAACGRGGLLIVSTDYSTSEKRFIATTVIAVAAHLIDEIRARFDPTRASLTQGAGDIESLRTSPYPDGKAALLARGVVVETLQKEERAGLSEPFPPSVAAGDVTLRASLISRLSCRTWTVRVSALKAFAGQEFYFASHPMFPADADEISGPIGHLRPMVGDVIVAVVELQPTSESSRFQYRVVDARLVRNAPKRENFRKLLLCCGALTDEARRKVVSDLLETGEHEAILEAVARNIVASDELAGIQLALPPIVRGDLENGIPEELKSLLKRRLWVLTVDDEGDEDHGVPFVSCVHPALCRAPGQPSSWRVRIYGIEPAPQRGTLILAKIKPEIRVDATQRTVSGTKVVPKCPVRYPVPVPAAPPERTEPLETLARLLTSDYLHDPPVSLQDVRPEILRDFARTCGSSIRKSLCEVGALFPIDILRLVEEGVHSRNDVSDEQVRLWCRIADSSVAELLVTLGFCSVREFSDEQAHSWLGTLRPDLAMALLEAERIRVEEIDASLRKRWVEEADSRELRDWLASGLVFWADVGSLGLDQRMLLLRDCGSAFLSARIEHEDIRVEELLSAVRGNLCDELAVIAARGKRWLEKATADEAMELVAQGIVLDEQLKAEQVEIWLAEEGVEFARWVCERRGTLWPNGLGSEARQRIGAHAKALVLVELARSQLVDVGCIPDERLNAWRGSRSIELLWALVDSGLLSTTDLPRDDVKRILSWFSDSNDRNRFVSLLTPVTTMQFVDEGLVALAEANPSIRNDYIDGHSAADLLRAARAGIVSSESFSRTARRKRATRLSLGEALDFARCKLLGLGDINSWLMQRWLGAKPQRSEVLDAVQLGIIDITILKGFCSRRPDLQQHFEELKTRINLQEAIRGVRFKLWTRKDFSAEQRRGFATSVNSTTVAHAIQHGLVDAENIPEPLLKRLRQDAQDSPGLAANLAEVKLLSADALPMALRVSWAESATGFILGRLARTGLVDAAVFSKMDAGKRAAFLAEPSTVAHLVEQRVIAADEIGADACRAWLDSPDTTGVLACTRLGLIDSSTVPEAIRIRWIESAYPATVPEMIETGLLTSMTELSERRRDDVLRDASLDQLIVAGARGDMHADLFSKEARSQRARALDPEPCYRLVKCGILESADIGPEVVSAWLEEDRIQRHQAYQLRRAGLLPDHLITKLLQVRWAAEAKSIGIAVEGIRMGLFDVDDISRKHAAQWVKSAKPDEIAEAVRLGLISEQYRPAETADHVPPK